MKTAVNEVPGSFFIEGKNVTAIPFVLLMLSLKGCLPTIDFGKEQTNGQGAAWWIT